MARFIKSELFVLDADLIVEMRKFVDCNTYGIEVVYHGGSREYGVLGGKAKRDAEYETLASQLAGEAE